MRGRWQHSSVQQYPDSARERGGKPTPLPPSHALGAHGRGVICFSPLPRAAARPARSGRGLALGYYLAAPSGLESAALRAGAPSGQRNWGAAARCARAIPWCAILGLALSPHSLLACAACYGQSDSAMARGMNWGIASLLAIILLVLGGIGAFFIHLARRSAVLAARDNL